MNQHHFSVLYVEDEPELQDIIKEELEAAGIQVSTASNGIEALHLLKKESFDVVLSDLKMPQLDGVGLRKLACEFVRGNPLVWIGFSGHSELSPDDLSALGFDEVLFKPLSTQMVIAVCVQHLEAKRQKASA